MQHIFLLLFEFADTFKKNNILQSPKGPLRGSTSNTDNFTYANCTDVTNAIITKANCQQSSKQS